jgi:ribulose kinase
MTIVAGVDFGTQSVRVSIVDSVKRVIGHGVSEYPVKRDRNDPDFATQSHDAHMRALVDAMQKALQSAGVSGSEVQAIALDTTGSTVIPVGEGLVPDRGEGHVVRGIHCGFTSLFPGSACHCHQLRPAGFRQRQVAW